MISQSAPTHRQVLGFILKDKIMKIGNKNSGRVDVCRKRQKWLLSSSNGQADLPQFLFFYIFL